MSSNKKACMNLSKKMTIPAQVMTRVVGDENVILDLANGTYYGLDPVGARIWQLMAEGQTIEQICEATLAEYDATREDIERDVLALVQTLTERQLVSVGA